MSLTKAQLMAKPKLRTEEIKLSKGKVTITELTAYDREDFLIVCQKITKSITQKTELLLRCLVDDKGKRLLTKADASAFGKAQTGKDLDLMANAAMTLNGLDFNAVEIAEKN